MANKRNLKKEINAVTAALISEYLLTSELIPGVEAEKTDAVLTKILANHDEFISRVGANGGKEPKLVKAYYKQLKADFNKKVDEVISDFESLTKSE